MEKILPEQKGLEAVTILKDVIKMTNAEIKMAWEQYPPYQEELTRHSNNLSKEWLGSEFSEYLEEFKAKEKELKAQFKQERADLYQRLENLKNKLEIEESKIIDILLEKNRKNIPIMLYKKDKDNRMIRLSPNFSLKITPVKDKDNKFISYGEYYRYIDEFGGENLVPEEA